MTDQDIDHAISTLFSVRCEEALRAYDTAPLNTKTAHTVAAVVREQLQRLVAAGLLPEEDLCTYAVVTDRRDEDRGTMRVVPLDSVSPYSSVRVWTTFEVL